MTQNRYSQAALWGFVLPFLAALGVLVCVATVPVRTLDHGLGSAIGLSTLAIFTISFLMCGRAVRNIKASNGQLRGYVVARIGQILPAAILVVLVVAYYAQARS